MKIGKWTGCLVILTLMCVLTSEMIVDGSREAQAACDSKCRRRTNFIDAKGGACVRFAFPTCQYCTGGGNCVINSIDKFTNNSCTLTENNNLRYDVLGCTAQCPTTGYVWVESDVISGGEDTAVSAYSGVCN